MDTPEKPKRPWWNRRETIAAAAAVGIVVTGFLYVASARAAGRPAPGDILTGEYRIDDRLTDSDGRVGAVTGRFLFRFPKEGGRVDTVSGLATVRWPDGTIAGTGWFDQQIISKREPGEVYLYWQPVVLHSTSTPVSVMPTIELGTVLPAELRIDRVEIR